MKNVMYSRVRPAQIDCIPVEFRDKWNGTCGCPVIGKEDKLLGWAANMPSHEGEEVEFISIAGEIGIILG